VQLRAKNPSPQPPSCCFAAEGGEKTFLAEIVSAVALTISAFFLIPRLGAGLGVGKIPFFQGIFIYMQLPCLKSFLHLISFLQISIIPLRKNS